MLQEAQCVVYGADAIYALRGDAGVIEWRTSIDRYVPQREPCSRCEHQKKCRELGGGTIDVIGCPIAEGWQAAEAAYQGESK